MPFALLLPGSALASPSRGVTAVARPALPPPAMPAVLPTRPFLGADTLDAFGVPRRHVDQVALQALVRERQFSVADAFCSEVQRKFELDPRYEAWPLEVASAFASADPSLTAALDAWIAALPDSAPAHVARAAQRWASAQHAGSPRGFEELTRLAHADLLRALELAPRSLAATLLMFELSYRSRTVPEGKGSWHQRALALCPSCSAPREALLDSLRPRHGGSLAAIERTAQAYALDDKDPRFVRFASWGDAVRCELARGPRQLEATEPDCEAAVRAAPQYWYYRYARARHARARGRVTHALTDLELALRERPQHRELLLVRSELLLRVGRHGEAVESLNVARRLDPADPAGVSLGQRTLRELVAAGWSASKQGDFTRARALLELALTLDPGHPSARRHHELLVAAEQAWPTLASKLELAESQPDDFELRRRLDAECLALGRPGEAIEMWTRFLRAHPEHARAYYERGGAHAHRGELTRARADARTACELGMRPACEQLAQLPSSP